MTFFRARRNLERGGKWEFDLMIMNRDGGEPRRLVADVYPVAASIWSPDGRSLLMSCADRSRRVGGGYALNLCSVDPAGGEVSRPTTLTQPDGSDVPLDWSPDGRRIAFRRDPSTSPCCQLWIARPDGSEAKLVGGSQGEFLTYLGAAWSADGQSLAVLAYERLTVPRSVYELWIGDAEGNRRRFLMAFEQQAGEVATLVGWSATGREIYLRVTGSPVYTGGVAVVDTVDRRFEVRLPRIPSTFGQVGLSSDRTMFGFVEGNTLKLVSADGSNASVLTRGVSTQVRPPSRPGQTTFSWSPDSNAIVYVADGECPTLLGLHTIGTGGKGNRRLTQPCRIVGTAGADTLEGTEATNAIFGLAGHDRIRAGSGADNAQGGQGNDKLDGGDGDDRINGGPGLDTIDSGTGWDAIISRDRDVDWIRCGPGRDIVWADDGDVVARDCEDVVWRS